MLIVFILFHLLLLFIFLKIINSLTEFLAKQLRKFIIICLYLYIFSFIFRILWIWFLYDILLILLNQALNIFFLEYLFDEIFILISFDLNFFLFIFCINWLLFFYINICFYIFFDFFISIISICALFKNGFLKTSVILNFQIYFIIYK